MHGQVCLLHLHLLADMHWVPTQARHCVIPWGGTEAYAWTLASGSLSPAGREAEKWPIIFHCLKCHQCGSTGFYENMEEEGQTETGGL